MNAEQLASLVRLPFAMVCIGKRASGKSVLIDQLVEAMVNQNKVYSIVLLSSTAHLNDDFPSLPASCKLPFSNDILQQIMDTQEKTDREKRKHLIVILDDVLSLREAKNSAEINSLYTRGRHFLCHPVILSQANSHVISPQIRANTDYWIVGKTIKPVYEAIWTQIAGIDKKPFIDLCERLTVDHQFIGIDVRKNSTVLSDWIWVIKAKINKQK